MMPQGVPVTTEEGVLAKNVPSQSSPAFRPNFRLKGIAGNKNKLAERLSGIVFKGTNLGREEEKKNKKIKK